MKSHLPQRSCAAASAHHHWTCRWAVPVERTCLGGIVRQPDCSDPGVASCRPGMIKSARASFSWRTLGTALCFRRFLHLVRMQRI